MYHISDSHSLTNRKVSLFQFPTWNIIPPSGDHQLPTIQSETNIVATEREELETKEAFIAFARVFSGVVKKGQKLFVLGPKYDPADSLHKVSC